MKSRQPFLVPDPATRLPAAVYMELRAWMLANDEDAQKLVDWSMNTAQPRTPEALAAEVIWIILCAGRSAQAARTIERKVWDAIHSGKPAVEGFGYKAKAAAIDRAWAQRQSDFDAFHRAASSGDVNRLLEWASSIPFVGDDTQFQLLKNFGCQVAKPDIWLCRVAGIADKPRRSIKIRFPACMALCQMLRDASGDSIPVVDSLIWLSCNKGILVVDNMGGPVSFNPRKITARSMMV